MTKRLIDALLVVLAILFCMTLGLMGVSAYLVVVDRLWGLLPLVWFCALILACLIMLTLNLVDDR